MTAATSRDVAAVACIRQSGTAREVSIVEKLTEYRKKRDFTKTAEPPPRPGRRSSKRLDYIIQKHDASRLHYDLRLELDGVLLSWAVTKGPSTNPNDKRLAVRTEDHPVAYGTFEGTIPKGEYGGGTVMLWDRGTWQTNGDPHFGLEKGHLSFELHGERLKGRWELVRMRSEGKRENWLLIKAKDDDFATESARKIVDDFTTSVASGRSMDQIAAGAPARKASQKQAVAGRSKTVSTTNLQTLLEAYSSVQLATLSSAVPVGDGWLHEVKFDGYRLLGYLADDTVRLYTRNGNDWTERFPSIAAALQRAKTKSAVLDMEAIASDAEGRSSFQALQTALSHGEQASIAAYAFDLLHLDGEDLRGLSLTERKKRLNRLIDRLPEGTILRYSNHVLGDASRLHEQICKSGLEGVISKQVDSLYQPGRQKTWLKVKCGNRQEFLIVGYSAAKAGDRALGALYLGYRKGRTLRYAGKVGTGFSMRDARALVDRFLPLRTQKPVFSRAEAENLPARERSAVQWVQPELLCEVAFAEWTNDGRVRHPSFLGLREDKDAKDVKRENSKSKPERIPKGTSTSKGTVDVGGITITNPNRVISKVGDITKGELAEYYSAAVAHMMPQIARHPLSLLRCPSGIDGSQCFYQRSVAKGFGDDVRTFDFHHKNKRHQYLYIEDQRGLLSLVQMGTIELHPWGSSVDAIDFPDRMIFDLDPAPEVPFEAVKLAARDLRKRLSGYHLESSVKCTGGKGLHVVVLLQGKDGWPAVKAFAKDIAVQMVNAAPEVYVATMSKAKRVNKIFIDYFRNDYTATAIADYCARAKPGAPVAMPLEWDELKRLQSSQQFTIQSALQRLKRQRLPSPPKRGRLPL